MFPESLVIRTAHKTNTSTDYPEREGITKPRSRLYTGAHKRYDWERRPTHGAGPRCPLAAGSGSAERRRRPIVRRCGAAGECGALPGGASRRSTRCPHRDGCGGAERGASPGPGGGAGRGRARPDFAVLAMYVRVRCCRSTRLYVFCWQKVRGFGYRRAVSVGGWRGVVCTSRVMNAASCTHCLKLFWALLFRVSVGIGEMSDVEAVSHLYQLYLLFLYLLVFSPFLKELPYNEQTDNRSQTLCISSLGKESEWKLLMSVFL